MKSIAPEEYFGLLTPFFIFCFFLFVSCNDSDRSELPAPATEEKWEPNLAYRWGQILLEATANDTELFRPRPTVTSRYLGLITASMYDAWTRYDSLHQALFLKAARRPSEEMTLENKEMAISYALYRAAREYFYSDSTLFRDFMKELGYDPDDDSLDPATPAGIGNLAAKTMIDARRNDGSNQYGEMSEGGESYFNYINYLPVNTIDENTDINRWQPKYFLSNDGERFAPKCLTPFWQNVEPLFLDSAAQFRSPPPPLYGSKQLEEEVAEVVKLQEELTWEDKALVEFMRDGPQSVQQAGHWLQFAQVVSGRDRHTLDEDVIMYFLVEAVAMDAFIACWDTKMHYDFARPFALVHKYYANKKIKGWGGPNRGIIEMDGSEWIPYSPFNFLCPPFPAYVSGHSTVSGGCAEILKLYKGSDYFGFSVKLVPGILTEPESIGDTVVLELPTFTETAELAGISRVLGGYHIQADNVEGLTLGRNVAHHVWGKYLKLRESVD